MRLKDRIAKSATTPGIANHIIGLILILFIPIWHWVIAPGLEKIPDDFTYQANVLSLDNFYDEKIKTFLGPTISKTKFSYQVVGKTANYLVIKSLFDVSTLSDQPIFSVTRLYYINPYTGEHVPVAGKSDRSGYLFAPRYSNEHGFTYWHVNYDAPAHLSFVNEEKINGLRVYHYQAHYTADQTANLGRLPGVPEKRGVKTDVRLQLWIEPVSGWLVKYHDNTLAYYYDRKTGERLAPWNQFSNRYTQSSIDQQVKKAIELRQKILIIDFDVPTLLLIIAVALFWLGLTKGQEKSSSILTSKTMHQIKSYLMYFTIAIVIIGAISEICYYIFYYQNQHEEFTIGISPWKNQPELLEAIRGFEDGLGEYGYHAGSNITFITTGPDGNIENQMRVLQLFVSKKVNLIYTLSTSDTIVAKGITTKIPIVFADVMYPVESNIIQSLISSNNNLVGARNYISPAQQFYMFEQVYPDVKSLGFIHLKGGPESEIQFNHFKAMLYKRDIKLVDLAALDANELYRQLLETKGQYNALYISCDIMLMGADAKKIISYIQTNKIPSFSCDKQTVIDGALMSYGANLYSVGKLAGNKAALILRGAEPRWLHTEAPSKGYLIINKNTAKLLGITIPKEIEQQADVIIDKETR